MAPSVSLFIVSDVRIYREGIASNLGQCRNFNIIGMSGSTADTLEHVIAACPDVTVLDVTGRDSHEVVRSLRQRAPSVKIIVFGVEESGEEILAYAESGAAGYVHRDASMNDLIAIIMSVVREELICSPRVAATLFRRVGSLAASRPAAEASVVLTSREHEVLSLLRESLANKEIAQRLNIAEATVKNHVHNLLAKLQIRKRSQAISATLSPLGSRGRRKSASVLGA